MTATHHVLSTPQLLREIFSWIDKDDGFSCEVGNDAEDAFLESIAWGKLNSLSEIDWSNYPRTYYYHKKGVLLRCGLVNTLWWCEAIRFIWRRLEGPGHRNTDFIGCFAGFRDPFRKQFHANLVTQADLFFINEDNAGIYDSLIQGVNFPNLQRLRLYCPKGHDYIPQLKCPSLRILEIDPQYECEFGVPEYALSQEQWNKVLCQISALFPALRIVKFLDYARVWPGALAHLKKNLPCLEAFDENFLVEGTETET